MILSVKEIAELLGVTEKTARGFMKEIRQTYQIKHITKWHIADWLKLDVLAIEASYLFRVKKDIKQTELCIEMREKMIKTGSLLLKTGKNNLECFTK